MSLEGCDYLILTASNESQSAVYRTQLEIRRRLGLLAGVGRVLVIPDVEGKRIGSGGSTLCCLLAVLKEELGTTDFPHDIDLWKQTLRHKRVLIMHAGGDSKRLPAYGPCGKLFVPIPGQWDSPIPLTLFDKQLPLYLELFSADKHVGQFIMTSGDVLLRFQTTPLTPTRGTVTGFCCPASPEQASRHGVFCLEPEQKVRLYLQKPTIARQQEYRALNSYHQALLDVGIMAFDGEAAVEMLDLFGMRYDISGSIVFESNLAGAVIDHGLDFYRELCCVFGTEATKQLHRDSAWGSGSKWSEPLLSELFDKARCIDFQAKVLTDCDFLDFGTVQQIINSGYRLVQEHGSKVRISDGLSINNVISDAGSITGSPAWVEGCMIDARLTLEGNNIVTGVDIDQSLSLGSNQCLDVVPARDDEGQAGWFVRCYGFNDDFKVPQHEGMKYCDILFDDWLQAVGVDDCDVWDPRISPRDRSLFNARLFPRVRQHPDFRDYLWMFTPDRAGREQIDRWKASPRFSHQEIASLTNGEVFLSRRQAGRIRDIAGNISYLFRPASSLSDLELCHIIQQEDNSPSFLQEAIQFAYKCSQGDGLNRDSVFISLRILHTLGAAFEQLDWPQERQGLVRASLYRGLLPECRDWLDSLGITGDEETGWKEWAAQLKKAAFILQSRTILGAGQSHGVHPRSCLRSDEIVWARSPIRLDMAGGWTDTPPYALEWGGAVLNAAVNLNGQPPIQAYLRVIPEPVIKIASIDLGIQVVIRTLDELRSYVDVTSGFSLAKAAFLQELFSPEQVAGSADHSLEQALKNFGGGIELTTLAAIPKGSGLGTSSIMGAVIVAAINRAMGRHLSNKQLFNAVLRLEQFLTTGGGWQDQIGGVLEGVKLILTEPGMIPNPSMQYLRKDLIEPALNGGRTLLYYTGITRLAKNILQEVVGRYLNRNHFTLKVLKQIRQAALEGAEIMGAMDFAPFGALLAKSWQFNKALDPNSTNAQVDALFERIGPRIHGAKLLGAGGGGFVLMACKTEEDARILEKELTENPSDVNARFFDYNISSEGLVVTVC